MDSMEAYTEHGMIFVPDVKFEEVPPGCKEVALRGYGYIAAVVVKDNETTCFGWKVRSNPIP
jgi:hypothetical protein